jgi:2-keto-4-pentenoate hydratase/2-oxohepta-3-ene-1,7-dioic acid hydratase in catechol pathway
LILYPNDSLVRFARAGLLGEEVPVALWEGRWSSLSQAVEDFDDQNLNPVKLEDLLKAVKAGDFAELERPPTRLGPPIARANSIICIGQNYAAHARESGAEPPEVPIVFFKHPSSLSGPFDPVSLPPGASKVDWEVELAIVIGRTLSYAKNRNDALSAIAGFSISNDVSEREYQIDRSGGQWSKGKSFPFFNPFGPFLVPTSQVGDADNLCLKSFVDGSPRQASNTSDMIFSVADVVLDLSRVMQLAPGDIINTGTPEGVAFSGKFPYLVAGNRVRLEIEHLGYQEQDFLNA